MESFSALPVLDTAYRSAVVKAAGQSCLDRATHQCLSHCAEVLNRCICTSSPQEVVQMVHQAAGGAAAAGLTRLCRALRAMEAAFQSCADVAGLIALWSRAETALAATREAVPGCAAPPAPQSSLSSR
jgi:HPt (histidine-containing phosphotransfer) domain-containing protein